MHPSPHPKMKRRRTALRMTVLLGWLALLGTGCEDDLYTEYFGERMTITSTAAPSGRTGEPYSWDIYAEVENDPNDGLYDYNFSLQKGVLPTGLSFSDEGDRARVAGTPMEAGSFPVTIRVSSDRLRFEDLEDEDSHIADYGDSKAFEIVIEGKRTRDSTAAN